MRGFGIFSMLSKQELIAETLYRHAPEAEVVLDVGYAQNPNPALRGEIHGIDIVNNEKPKHYREVRKVDLNLCSIPYDNSFFDAVGMGCVLAHVTNPFGLLAELHRVLKKDGILVLSTPNPNYYWETVLNVFFHRMKHRVCRAKWEEHFCEFSRFTMRTIAHRAGFSVIDEVGTTFHVVKFGWKFQPKRFPGISYEIIYVLKKDREPSHYTTYETKGEIIKVPSALRGRGVSQDTS